MNRKILSFFLCLVFAVSAQAQKIDIITWEPVANGVWKAVVGNPEAIDLLKAAESKPREEALNRMPSQDFPAVLNEVKAELIGGKTYLRVPLAKDELVYGLGLNFKRMNHTGQVMELHVDHYGGKDNGRTHAPVPFYVSSNGYGVLINSARYIKTHVGLTARTDHKNPPKEIDRNARNGWSSRPRSEEIEMMLGAPGTEIYVFAGPTMMNAVQRYNLFNGGGFIPPKWGLGFTHRTPTLFSDKDVEEEVNKFDEKGFPLSFVGLEPGWHTASYPCTFEWDPRRFPNPEEFSKKMLDRGIRLNLWLNPYVAEKASTFDEFAKVSGTHKVWNGIVPDLTLPRSNELFDSLFTKEHIDIGVSGYKIDEVDGYDVWLWPDFARFPSGLDGEQMRQVYGTLVQKMTTDMFRKKNQRTYGLVRASNAGASRFPYVIYNDYYNHKDFITALCNSSFIGVLWTPEVRASRTGEEWLRRMQTACFSPFAMLNAWADGTKPWTYPEVYEQVKDVALLRMQMIPYLYSTFAQYYFEGTPPFRAMQLTEGFFPDLDAKAEGKLDGTKNPYAEGKRKEVKDQYMMGDYLMVAPLFAGEKERKVILPKGNWYDFYTGEFVGNNQTITAKPGLDHIPVYVREGGIIPMTEAKLRAQKPGEVLPLEVRVYGKEPGAYTLYDDDGVTFDYEKGNYTQMLLSTTKDKKGKLRGKAKMIKGKKNQYGKINWVFMTK
ncbi:glycosyl hydrolase family 31 [Fulvitalea axinellae]|uniref:Glycosyl hydrolase family 31 n=1 Tax=Fulvitalea axinellae TaxID=1182444 RepID=A0AAU9C9K7_9BACT|nr:glycosyl hydrolase family 31 [Fulvitalea axinellae]